MELLLESKYPVTTAAASKLRFMCDGVSAKERRASAKESLARFSTNGEKTFPKSILRYNFYAAGNECWSSNSCDVTAPSALDKQPQQHKLQQSQKRIHPAYSHGMVCTVPSAGQS